jgi:hypothetical protein
VSELVPLTEIVYDPRARDGTWCRLAYPGHPHGCPSFPTCPSRRADYRTLQPERYRWFAVIERFDLREHAKVMQRKHPIWSHRQCRNLLYWQASVRKRLATKATAYYHRMGGSIILDRPEANGINVFATLERVGVLLERIPELVQKTIFFAVAKEGAAP